jgi:hypothetical protein
MVLTILLLHVAAAGTADDPDPLPAKAGAPRTAAEQPATASIARGETPAEAGTAPGTSGAPEPAKFDANAEWQIAGYNNEEIIYTILVTNEDSRIIRCNAALQGFYIENGKKVGISDRQSSTIFPGKKASVGHWMGMDQKSGATYSVKCRPI